MKRILNIFSVLFVTGLSYAQTTTPSSTENYIHTRVHLSDPAEQVQKQIETVQYFDGLGRPKQTVKVKASPTGKDIVEHIEYDGFGRQTKDYLPIPQSGTQNGAIYTSPLSSASVQYGGEKIYAEKTLENSPLDRVREQVQVGNDWGTKPVKFTYEANTAEDLVRDYQTSTTWDATGKMFVTTVQTSQSVPSAQLYKSTVTDEDGNKIIQFKNAKGQRVLLRKVVSATENADTYYVYNEYDLLTFVIPPTASVSGSTSAVTLDNLCYQYRHDGQYRLVEKKLPGKGWEYLVYDKQDRLVALQDANLRAKGHWQYTKYDQFGRGVITGIATGSSRITEQNMVDGLGVNNVNRVASAPFSRQGVDVYYNNQDSTYPNSTKWVTLLSLNYYDTYPAYSFNPPFPSTILGKATLTDNPANNGKSTNSLPLVNLVKNIEDDNWTKSYNYYDTKGREIGSYSINHLGGYTKTETELDFAGVPQKTNTYHKRKSDEVGVTVKERFVYDNGNRLKQHFHQVDDNPEQLLSENTYNEISELVNKKVGNNLQSIDYTYNIRGWLTDINKNQMTVSDLGGKLFSYKVKYTNRDGIENPDSVQFSGKNVIPRYNGNVTEIDWRAVETLGANPSLTPKRYGYAYDTLNRLTAGYYQNPNNPYSKENTESLTYDLNGNIIDLYRTSVMEYGSNTATVIDNLAYTYNGNQAIKIKDNSGNSTGYEGTAGYPIDYDGNGNMKSMVDKNIAGIAYNHLNLPNIVTIGAGQVTTDITTKYRADGSKVRKENTKTSVGVAGTTSSKETTDYLDGFQYFSSIGNTGGGSSEMLMMSKRAFEPQAFTPIGIIEPTIDPPFGGGGWTGTLTPVKTPDLQFFPTAEGFYDYIKNQYIYNYSDHLGNVRVSFARNSAGGLEIVDANDYYPFGMNHLKTGNAYFGQSSFKNYKFGKKELQETGFYDFGNRMFMPDLDRWFSPDPLSEEFSDWSPYNYAFNNPMRFTDPDGNAPEDAVSECCAHLKGFALAMADDVMGTNFRNKYATNSNEYRNGVTTGHGASMIMSAAMAVDGAGSIGGGTMGLVASASASGSGVGALPGAGGALISGATIAKGTIELAGAGAIMSNTINNMKSDNDSSAAKAKSKEGVAKNGTLKPGPFAGEGLPAKNGKSRKFTTEERKIVNAEGDKNGCHTCGNEKPGTKSGNWILDHQPPNATVKDGFPQTFYPHCKYCSSSQGGIIGGMKKKGLIPPTN